MADLIVHKGKTSKLLRFFIQDTRQSDGSGLTGLVFNSAGLTAYYIREGGASAVQITLATMTVGTWATGGFKEIDATNMPGYYELGIPDAALSSTAGVDSVTIMLKGAANMAVAIKELQLTDFDPNDAVRAGLTALPNVASGSAGAIPTTGTGANQISVTSGAVILTTAERAAVSAALLATALTELAQAQPSATPALNDAIMLLYMALRNARTVTATTDSIANNAGTVVTKSTIGDDGTTFTRAKLVSGP